MIVVKVELHSAREGNAKEIGRMIIGNVSGKGEGRYHKRADYRVYLMRRGTKMAVLRSGSVENYPRLSYSIWRLVFRALKSVLPEETKSSPRGEKNGTHQDD